MRASLRVIIIFCCFQVEWTAFCKTSFTKEFKVFPSLKAPVHKPFMKLRINANIEGPPWKASLVPYRFCGMLQRSHLWRLWNLLPTQPRMHLQKIWRHWYPWHARGRSDHRHQIEHCQCIFYILENFLLMVFTPIKNQIISYFFDRIFFSAHRLGVVCGYSAPACRKRLKHGEPATLINVPHQVPEREIPQPSMKHQTV